MELIHGTHKASKFTPQDFITNMPDNVVTNILDRLPLRDAVRTSILARNWRFRWTMLSQLVIDARFFMYLSQTRYRNDHVRVLSRILLHLRGAVTKFSLSIDEVIDDEDINNWILFLSSKGIKDLTLGNWYETPLKLHTHLFSCLELKHLKLSNCYFNPPPTFHGFPNLLSLKLSVVFEENIDLASFFTGCPLLESLTIKDRGKVGKVKLVDIAKLDNLKILSLRLYDLDMKMIKSSSTIFELLGSLPKLQELDLDFKDCQLTETDANKRFSTSFPCVKTLTLSDICLDDGMELSCAFDMIRSFPNLQNLVIRACDQYAGPPPPTDYDTTGLLQLRSVMFGYLKGSENELCLIKYLLACSPFLKRFVVCRWAFVSLVEKLKFARKLLMLHRASPVAEIEFL
ncbi:putative F-box domain, leucine-rich repeat domain superfamily, F-box-like domain superfamily [Helianthus annuus]|uniref:F-box domain, leucine-rich repeat domain superfamily, F-box-like domain superfamily n=1 Tax=Helianthus annuus TaxID=4232 RepID=A0A9K3H000_HELAN|nr:F-box/FBD/LRR-repeat protein At1g13570-like [Helianthus annuus]KAF5762055.1 putative F-box domain, leucine-rich repeat domain superfamily, F-box-like domain superfamily [Helianthus annuus]KAJ0439809.1 putative F-box domain, leucine-rich repeat domain superfamily, F-box-like domain superfamily [Helianthus annuus]KAJ0462201.1 putative F-box domain, leucine-rich repeat domain superfamily, F-box-like domain superfamily [Helianthus annuus]KAJ0642587.1 putative F-box domain, leucine-rich repeat do